MSDDNVNDNQSGVAQPLRDQPSRDPPSLDISALKHVFKVYPGPVLTLDRSAQITPINTVAHNLITSLSNESNKSLLPGLVQLAVKAGSERRAVTRTIDIPEIDHQIEFILLPQPDGTQLVIGRDTTFEVNVRSALTQSRTRFKDLVDVAADFAWETDANGLFCYISSSGAVGYQPEELLGHRASTLIVSPESAPNPLPFVARSTVRNVELWVQSQSGEPACIMVSSMPLLNDRNEYVGARGIAVDVTVERHQQSELARLKLRDNLVAHIVNALRNEVAPTEMLHAAASTLAHATSADSCVVQVLNRNQNPLEIAAYGTGLKSDQVQQVVSMLSDTNPIAEGVLDNHRYLAISTGYQGASNGVVILWRDRDAPEWDEDERTLLTAVEPQFGIVFRQISDQFALERLSRTDSLTGLRNRRAFIDDFNREMVRYERYGDGGALLFVDLDNFKQINDLCGHAKGDEALVAIANILATHTRTYDLVCRLGGDEFAVLIEGADEKIATLRAESFLKALQEWTDENLDNAVGFGMSIGIAIFKPNTGETFERLIMSADAAMYQAKKSGKNQICFAEAPDKASPETDIKNTTR